MKRCTIVQSLMTIQLDKMHKSTICYKLIT